MVTTLSKFNFSKIKESKQFCNEKSENVEHQTLLKGSPRTMKRPENSNVEQKEINNQFPSRVIMIIITLIIMAGRLYVNAI